MVVFSCDGCGEVLKKSQVDTHAERCRSCNSVSCADCAVSYFGDDYRAHTTCITEAERYEKSVYKGNTKKKRNPQEEWMELIEASANDAPPGLKDHLVHLASLGNVPRKEKQFRNFTANSLNLRGRQESVVSDVWKHLSALRQKETDARKKIEDAKKAQEAIKKQKQEEEAQERKAEEDAEDQKALPSSRKLRKTVKKILKKEKSSVKIKLLRTKVFDELGLDKSLKKKLKKLLEAELNADDSKIKVDGKLVQLV